MGYVNKAVVEGQAWKFHFAPAAWIGFLFILPAVYHASAAAGFAIIVFPGVYLFAWIGFLMHETWHRYVRGIPNNAVYTVLAVILVSDPQIYRLVHGHHHAGVHTWEDMEFHPLGEIRSRLFRIVNNAMEIFIGIAYLVAVSLITVPRDGRFRGKYRPWKTWLSVVIWAAYLAGIGLLSATVFHVPAGDVAISYAIVFWAGSLVLHHSQLVEHGNLIVQGARHQRDRWTRNLGSSGFPEKFFLFLTHGDSREHVLHHTEPAVYSRPFPGKLPMSDNATVVTLKQYWTILKDMLAGRMSER
jgi:hypothetical protein